MLLTEEQTLINLAFFRWLHDEYGMELDIYALDAGAIDGKRFYGKVDSDRFQRMVTSPEMFEQYLPFAMALGVEKKWARAFADIVTEAPAWYVGSHDGSSFRPSNLVSSLDRVSTRTSSAMTSQPRSSSGSGFSGGGSSGGGFGGGASGAFQSLDGGRWSATGAGANGTLQLDWSNGERSSWSLEYDYENGRTFVNGNRWLRGENQRCS